MMFRQQICDQRPYKPALKNYFNYITLCYLANRHCCNLEVDYKGIVIKISLHNFYVKNIIFIFIYTCTRKIGIVKFKMADPTWGTYLLAQVCFYTIFRLAINLVTFLGR